MTENEIAAVLQPFVDSHKLAGAVTLVADKNQILHLEAIGWADIAAQKPMTADSLFWIASQTKPMTSTALMMLVDEGKVALDDAVEKYLPEFRGQMVVVERDENHALLKKPLHPITIRNVLSHTSGLPFSSAMEQPTLDMYPLAARAAGYAMSPLGFEPGSRYEYSNEGINTAGRIIEVVSGRSYGAFMQERLFSPLGMTDTTFWPNDEQSRLAKAYKPDADKTGLEETTISYLHYPLGDRSVRYPVPAGGLFSTATDVARFCQMILNGGEWNGNRYVSAASIEEMTRKQTGDLPENHGLGWGIENDTFGHGGAYSTNMNIDIQRGLITVYLVQHDGYPEGGHAIQPAFVDKAIALFAKATAET